MTVLSQVLNMHAYSLFKNNFHVNDLMIIVRNVTT